MNAHSKVLTFIHNPELRTFSSVAIDVFRHQYSSVASYRKYCDQLGISPDKLGSIDEIPLVSTLAFKHCDLSEANDSSERSLTFLTSGTTRGKERRGRHRVAHPEIYRASALAHLRAMLFPDAAQMRMLAIHPTADRLPESSLSAMITWCIEKFGAGDTLCAADPRGLDVDAAIAFLQRSEHDAAPVCILGTTAAAASIFRELSRRNEKIQLPGKSRMMDTGGPKGQTAPLSSRELIDLAVERLGLDPDYVINEYGMTELCSQLYDATALNCDLQLAAGDRFKIAPPWMRPMAIDPATLRPLPEGAVGMLGFLDLANVCSVSAILTEDLGIADGNRVRILGRAVAGGARGCALSIAQFASATNTGPKEEHAPFAAEAVGHSGVHAREMQQRAALLRSSLSERLTSGQIAGALADAVEQWRDRAFARRRETLARVASELGFSLALLDASLDALLQPFTRQALTDAAARVPSKAELLGFVMPGNVIGAGLHEVALALIAGRSVMVKTAAREPFFFTEFAKTLVGVSPALTRRIAVQTWSRKQHDLTRVLQQETDWLVAYGDDATIDALGGNAARVVGFGSKLSGAVVMRSANGSAREETARRLALDVTLFEQLGCLSPHHIFVECIDDAEVEDFAESVVRQLELLVHLLPPPEKLELEDGAALRNFRDTALWRSLGGESVRSIEVPNFGACAAFDRDAHMSPSPGLRRVYVSAIRDHADLHRRVAPVRGRLEAFALAGDESELLNIRDVLVDCGVSYLALPGAMQSPPLTWRHGGGAFLDKIMEPQ